MIEKAVVQLKRETFSETKTRAQTMAAATGKNTMAVERVHVLWGIMNVPRGYYDPSGTYTEWTT